ncbi:hypothetical protein TNCV_3734001 [Trichonephila clavipes]|nr:hypothetical protein TNCV_3734001 [Trichonephila clavipes]
MERTLIKLSFIWRKPLIIRLSRLLHVTLAKKGSEIGIKCTPSEEIRVKSPYSSPTDFCAFDLFKRAVGKQHTSKLKRTLENGLRGKE